MRTYKGLFKPKNPEKYRGDPSNIIYRSRWESVLMSYLDKHKDVIEWASEELVIPYRSPIDGKRHRYFPDFWVRMINREGKEEIVVIEVKPKSQTIEPKAQKSLTKKYLYEVQTWGVNQAKWDAAKRFCEERNWKFEIFTEYELGLKK